MVTGPPEGERGGVIWITGLSGSGKTTLAREVVQRLRRCASCAVLLDGDELREALGVAGVGPNHDRKARLALAMQYARLCRMIAEQGVTVVIATISLFHEVHRWNRANLPGYFEVYLKVPMEELRRRDAKGIYSRFDSDELRNVAGLDLVVDEPEAPDWMADFDAALPATELANQLIELWSKRRLV